MKRFYSLLLSGSLLLSVEGIAQLQHETVSSEKGIPTLVSPSCSLDVKIAAQSPSCSNRSDGAIELILEEGTGPCNFFWSTGDTTGRIERLVAGEYKVLVQDQKGCQSRETVLLQPSSRMHIDVERSLPGCGGTTLGSIHLVVSGGFPPYSYNWSTGTAGPTARGLTAGNYLVDVSDQRGCVETREIVLPAAPPLSVSDSKVRPASTSTAKDGEVELFVSGGVPPYNFRWLHNNSSLPFLMNAPGAVYEVVVSDALNCQQSFRFDLSYRQPVSMTTSPVQIAQSRQVSYSSDIEVQLNDIYWEYGSQRLKGAARTELDRLSVIMKRYPGLTLEINSHTDSRSSASFNLDLSNKRARAVVAYLVNTGVDPSRLIAIGHGERQLLNDCADGVECTRAQHRVNRRTTFRITNFDESLMVRDAQGNPDYEGIKDRLIKELLAISPQSTRPATPADERVETVSPVTKPASQAEKTSDQSTQAAPSNTATPIKADPVENYPADSNSEVWWESGEAYGVYLLPVNGLDGHTVGKLNALGPLQHEEWADGQWHYVLGYFTSRGDAVSALEEAKKTGISGAYLLTYRNGKRSR